MNLKEIMGKPIPKTLAGWDQRCTDISKASSEYSDEKKKLLARRHEIISGASGHGEQSGGYDDLTSIDKRLEEIAREAKDLHTLAIAAQTLRDKAEDREAIKAAPGLLEQAETLCRELAKLDSAIDTATEKLADVTSRLNAALYAARTNSVKPPIIRADLADRINHALRFKHMTVEGVAQKPKAEDPEANAIASHGGRVGETTPANSRSARR